MSALTVTLDIAISIGIVLAGVVLGLVVTNLIWNGDAPRYRRNGGRK